MSRQRRRSERVTFAGGLGHQLAGIIDLPVAPPKAWLVFTHCFTCTKDIKHIARISHGLAEDGFAVLRYDLTGLGHSHGEFEHSNFLTNQADLLAAVAYLRTYQSLHHHNDLPDVDLPNADPQLFLIGHSFGGAVSLSLAQQIPQVRGVISLSAPSDTHHLASLLERLDPRILQTGIGEVSIGGTKHRIRQQMLENFREIQLASAISNLDKPVLLMHSPEDETLSYDHAIRLYQLLSQRSQGAPPTLVCLSQMNHLFTQNSADLVFVTQVIAAWINRQLV